MKADLYIPHIAKGRTVAETARHFGKTHGSVTQALRRAGYPASPAEYLQRINARMLAPSVVRVCGRAR